MSKNIVGRLDELERHFTSPTAQPWEALGILLEAGRLTMRHAAYLYESGDLDALREYLRSLAAAHTYAITPSDEQLTWGVNAVGRALSEWKAESWWDGATLCLFDPGAYLNQLRARALAILDDGTLRIIETTEYYDGGSIPRQAPRIWSDNSLDAQSLSFELHAMAKRLEADCGIPYPATVEELRAWLFQISAQDDEMEINQ